MATNDQKPANEVSKSLKAHKEPDRLAAHPEQARLEAYKEETDEIVPAVSADVDETPKFIKYGAAVLPGLAFGVGCYIWFGDGVPSAPQNPQGPLAATGVPYNIFDRPTYYDIFYTDTDIPAPFDESEYVAVTEVYAPETAIASDNDGAIASASAIPVVVYLFKYDSSEIPETKELTDIANRAAKAGATLDVKAYTDEHGRVAYNKRLSERRAHAIADYLIAHGMPAAKITTHAMGPTHAFGSDAADRRAEVVAVVQ